MTESLIGQPPDASAYVGRRTCGCVVSAVVDAPGEDRYVAKTLAEWKRDGRMIERVTVKEARVMLSETSKSPCFLRGHKPAHLAKALPAQGKQENLL